MSKLDGITKGTRVETTGTALGFEDGVGLHGTVLKTTGTHAYVNLDGRPNTDRRTIDGVDTACTVYFWPYLKALPETAISVGDTVKVLEASTSWSHMKGVVGEVLDVTSNSGSILVKDPTGKGMWPREGGLGWWLSRHEVEKVEAKIELKAGDTVRVIKDGGFTSAGTPSVGDILEVTKVSHSGDLVYTTSGYTYWYGHKSYGDEIAPEPLAERERELLKKAEPRKLQVGDSVRLLSNGGFAGDLGAGDMAKVTAIHGGIVTLSNGLMYYYNSKSHVNEIEYIEENIKQEETAVNNQDFKTGDIVEAIETASGVVAGKRYTVRSVDNEYAGQRIVRTVNGPAAYAYRFKLVPTEKVVFKVGDTVEIVKGTLSVTEDYIGQQGTVTDIVNATGSVVVKIGLSELYHKPEGLKLVTAKAKTASTEIKSHQIQKGDLIVAFWNEGGVETRRKGIAHENDGDDDWSTEEGEYLTYDGDANNPSASHIYLIERPEKAKEPEIADGTYYVTSTMKGVGPWKVTVANEDVDWKYGDNWERTAYGSYETLVETKNNKRGDMAFHTEDPRKPIDLLDKSKVYIAKTNTSYGADYLLAHKGGEWRFANKAHAKNGVTEDSSTVEGVENQLIEGGSSWHKPVEYIAPPKTVQEQLDELGVKATDLYFNEGSNLYYQFIGEGKARHTLGTSGIERDARASDIRGIKDGTYKKAN